MVKISEILKTRERPTLSFEFFPPKGENSAVQDLAHLNPDFISATCGALGSQTPTLDFVLAQSEAHKFPVMPHVAMAGLSHEELGVLIDAYRIHGVNNILALRGDLTDEQKKRGYPKHALDLAELIKKHNADTSIGVAAHPEKHPESESFETDRRHLVLKLELADFAITQFFFDPNIYTDLVEDLSRRGCNKPIIPGIMLFTSESGLRRIADLNNTHIPDELNNELEHANTPTDIGKLAVTKAGELVEELLKQGAPGVHIYTMNKSDTTLELCRQLATPLDRPFVKK